MNEYDIDEPKISRKKLAGAVLVFVILILAGMGFYYESKINQTKSSASNPIAFTVSKGSSTRQIANSLADKNIIEHPRIFMVYIYLHHAEGKIQAGEYQLDSNMPITEVVDILTAGKVVSQGRDVTILEGWSNQQIAKRLSDLGIVSKNDFEQTLANHFDFKFSNTAIKYNYQGFLFPDTYTFSKSATSNDIISKMLKNFETKLIGQNPTGDQIILASIIEKEVGRNKEVITDEDIKTLQEERLLVASVFYNRLEIGMPLESDATVNYFTGKADRSVTIADTKIKSPYNTYQNQGLPPMPISNPGLNSIMAAIHPAKSDYLFFLNSPDGTAYFAKTLDGHNENRAKYLR